MDLVGWVKDVGLLATLALVISSMFFFILKWVLEQFKTELIANRSERISYLDTLHKIGEKIEAHNIRSEKFCDNVTLEHKEMIASLGRINGYKE